MASTSSREDPAIACSALRRAFGALGEAGWGDSIFCHVTETLFCPDAVEGNPALGRQMARFCVAWTTLAKSFSKPVCADKEVTLCIRSIIESVHVDQVDDLCGAVTFVYLCYKNCPATLNVPNTCKDDLPRLFLRLIAGVGHRLIARLSLALLPEHASMIVSILARLVPIDNTSLVEQPSALHDRGRAYDFFFCADQLGRAAPADAALLGAAIFAPGAAPSARPSAYQIGHVARFLRIFRSGGSCVSAIGEMQELVALVGDICKASLVAGTALMGSATHAARVRAWHGLSLVRPLDSKRSNLEVLTALRDSPSWSSRARDSYAERTVQTVLESWTDSPSDVYRNLSGVAGDVRSKSSPGVDDFPPPPFATHWKQFIEETAKLADLILLAPPSAVMPAVLRRGEGAAIARAACPLPPIQPPAPTATDGRVVHMLPDIIDVPDLFAHVESEAMHGIDQVDGITLPGIEAFADEDGVVDMSDVIGQMAQCPPLDLGSPPRGTKAPHGDSTPFVLTPSAADMFAAMMLRSLPGLDKELSRIVETPEDSLCIPERAPASPDTVFGDPVHLDNARVYQTDACAQHHEPHDGLAHALLCVGLPKQLHATAKKLIGIYSTHHPTFHLRDAATLCLALVCRYYTRQKFFLVHNEDIERVWELFHLVSTLPSNFCALEPRSLAFYDPRTPPACVLTLLGYVPDVDYSRCVEMSGHILRELQGVQGFDMTTDPARVAGLVVPATCALSVALDPLQSVRGLALLIPSCCALDLPWDAVSSACVPLVVATALDAFQSMHGTRLAPRTRAFLSEAFSLRSLRRIPGRYTSAGSRASDAIAKIMGAVQDGEDISSDLFAAFTAELHVGDHPPEDAEDCIRAFLDAPAGGVRVHMYAVILASKFVRACLLGGGVLGLTDLYRGNTKTPKQLQQFLQARSVTVTVRDGGADFASYASPDHGDIYLPASAYYLLHNPDTGAFLESDYYCDVAPSTLARAASAADYSSDEEEEDESSSEEEEERHTHKHTAARSKTPSKQQLPSAEKRPRAPRGKSSGSKDSTALARRAAPGDQQIAIGSPMQLGELAEYINCASGHHLNSDQKGAVSYAACTWVSSGELQIVPVGDSQIVFNQGFREKMVSHATSIHASSDYSSCAGTQCAQQLGASLFYVVDHPFFAVHDNSFNRSTVPWGAPVGLILPPGLAVRRLYPIQVQKPTRAKTRGTNLAVANKTVYVTGTNTDVKNHSHDIRIVDLRFPSIGVGVNVVLIAFAVSKFRVSESDLFFFRCFSTFLVNSATMHDNSVENSAQYADAMQKFVATIHSMCTVRRITTTSAGSVVYGPSKSFADFVPSQAGGESACAPEPASKRAGSPDDGVAFKRLGDSCTMLAPLDEEERTRVDGKKKGAAKRRSSADSTPTPRTAAASAATASPAPKSRARPKAPQDVDGWLMHGAFSALARQGVTEIIEAGGDVFECDQLLHHTVNDRTNLAEVIAHFLRNGEFGDKLSTTLRSCGLFVGAPTATTALVERALYNGNCEMWMNACVLHDYVVGSTAALDSVWDETLKTPIYSGRFSFPGFRNPSMKTGHRIPCMWPCKGGDLSLSLARTTATLDESFKADHRHAESLAAPGPVAGARNAVLARQMLLLQERAQESRRRMDELQALLIRAEKSEFEALKSHAELKRAHEGLKAAAGRQQAAHGEADEEEAAMTVVWKAVTEAATALADEARVTLSAGPTTNVAAHYAQLFAEFSTAADRAVFDKNGGHMDKFLRRMVDLSEARRSRRLEFRPLPSAE